MTESAARELAHKKELAQRSKRRKIYRRTLKGRSFFTLHAIKRRCEWKKSHVYHRYGGRGIKCLITREEIEKLIVRDNALSMQRPSIDRIDNDGNYTFENCRFIERNKNRQPYILNAEKVMEIRALKPKKCGQGFRIKVAKQYGITPEYVTSLWAGRCWPSVNFLKGDGKRK